VEEGINEIDLGKSAFYILVVVVPRHDNMRRKIEHMLSATTMMERVFMQNSRPDLRDRIVSLRRELQQLYLVNWEWMSLYIRSPYLPPKAKTDLKSLFKRQLKVELIRTTLMSLLLDLGIFMEREEYELEPPMIGWSDDQ